MGIEVLFPKDEKDIDGNTNLNVDIIALHGLNGSSEHTWTDPKTGSLWLRDFLPEEKLRARIMLFGYDAQAAFSDSIAGVEEHGRDLLRLLSERRSGEAQKRPIIFVGHSLGGIVIKQALVIASREPYYYSIFDNLKGVIFFGTPHQGSRFGTYGAVLARIAGSAVFKPAPTLLQTLKASSEELLVLTEELKKLLMVKQVVVVSFYETRAMVLGKPIVEKESALLKISEEIAMPVAGDHRHMCRFSSSNDKTYTTFVKMVKDILSDEKDVQNEYYIVPHKVNQHFTGRYDIRQRLSDTLIDGRRMNSRTQHRFVLHGMGGSGKTQLALKFAQDYQAHFWGVFWIDATNLETAYEGFHEMARNCKQQEDIDTIKAWLSGKDDWLLIIDNADDPSLDIGSFFPTGNRGTILITSRNPDFKKYSTEGMYHRVEEMLPEDAIKLLLRTAGLEGNRNEEMEKSAGEVVAILGHLALAIVQAGAVIRQQLCRLNAFGKLYKQHKQEVLEMGRSNTDDDYHYSVFTTWEISLKKIEEIEGTPAILALELLRLFAFMHFDGITEDIFQNAREHSKLEEDFHSGAIFHSTIMATLMQPGWDSLLFHKSIKVLLDFSLITVDDNEKISMHPLVHEWSKIRMSVDNKGRAWDSAASTLAMSIRWEYDSSHYRWRRLMLPHIDACLVDSRKRLFLEGEDQSERLIMAGKFAMTYRENGRSQDALDLELEDLRWKEATLPADHQSLLITKSHVADILTMLNRHAESIEIREAVLSQLRSVVQKDEQPFLQMMCAVADSYIRSGNTEKGMEKSLEALEACKTATGEGSPISTTALNLVSHAQALRGEWDKAASTSEIVMASLRRNDPLHINTLLYMQRSAIFYEQAKQYKRARELQQRAAELMEETLGAQHRETVMAIGNIVAFRPQDSMWKKNEGLQLRQDAVKRMEMLFGRNDPRTLICAGHLADSYFMRGELEMAKSLDERRVKGLKASLGSDHSDTISAMKDLQRDRKTLALRNVVYCWVPKKIRARSE